MKKIFLLSISYLMCLQMFAQRSNCSVSPEPNTFTQQDGSVITLVAFGNEQEHYLETPEGYTVLVNENNIFEYAYIDANGNLSPSGIKASNKTTFAGKNSFSKNLRYSKTQKAILAEAFSQLAQNNNKNLGKAGPQGFPAKGIRKVCVLLIQYPDLLATIQKSVFENLFNQINYGGTGSVRDYYLQTSYGQLTLNSDVFGWYMADMNYINYGKNINPSGANARDLVRDAVVAADSAGVDFSPYDNDLDGKIDGLLILHAGLGAEEASPNSNNYIWSFQSNYAGKLLVDGVNVSSYCMFPEKRYGNASYPAVGIGVIVHEFGHLLNLPDLYSTQGNGDGAGHYTTMAFGCWLNGEKTPSLFDAWSKMSLEWHTPTIISQNGTYTIPKCAADSNFSYRINTSKAEEYFLLENRQLKGNDRYIKGKGLAIWHINSNYAKLNGGNVNNDTSKYGTGLMQADGQRHLEKATNRGDAGDLYPGTSNNRNFSGSTNPSSNFYPTTAGGVRASSNITISNITQNSDSSITFKVEVDIWNTGVKETKMQNNVVIYPNPFGNELTVSFESLANQQALLNIYNVLGQQIFSSQMNTKSGINLFNLNNTNSLEANGIYFVKLSIDNQTYTYKIMKSN